MTIESPLEDKPQLRTLAPEREPGKVRVGGRPPGGFEVCIPSSSSKRHGNPMVQYAVPLCTIVPETRSPSKSDPESERDRLDDVSSFSWISP
jgi:hypothetical protein